MDGFQSGVAVLELIRICWSVGKFLKRIKDADKVAEEVYARVERLSGVLHSIVAVLNRRVSVGLPSEVDEIALIEGRIVSSAEACMRFFDKLEQKVEGGFDMSQPKQALLTRFKIACKNTPIANRQKDLDARISILQTDLVVLQIFDHAYTHDVIGSNHADLVKSLHALSQKVNEGHQLLRLMWEEQNRKVSIRTTQQSPVPSPSDFVDLEGNTVFDERDTDALPCLDACLRGAGDVHERYTSSYAPDIQSELDRHPHILDTRAPSLVGVSSPPPETITQRPSRQASDIAQEPSVFDAEESPDEHDIWQPEILDEYIAGYRSNYEKERDAEHYNQAEINLNEAIRYSEMRATHHGIPFSDRLQLHEEIAVLYQRQGKSAEAVKKVNQLLSEVDESSTNDSDLVRARQLQILASIYFDRHSKKDGAASLNLTTSDIEMAEKNARRAYNKRSEHLKNHSGCPVQEIQRQDACTDLLVKILDAQHKNIEAGVFNKLLSVTDTSSSAAESIRRASTRVSGNSVGGYDVVVNPEEVWHATLIDAIKAKQYEQVDDSLAGSDFDVERLCPQGKTILMYAVESADERTVMRLLDPNIGGANVNTANRRGITALHVAAEEGLDAMIRCLVDHDANIDAKDRRGETPTVKAVRRGHTRSVQILYEQGADVTTKDVEEWSLLHHSVCQKQVSITRLLVSIKPELRDYVNRSDQTALLYCAEQCSVDCLGHARALLTHETPADVNFADSVSRTVLWHAASKPRTKERNQFVELLVQHGAEFDRRRPPPKGMDYPALRERLVPTRGSNRGRTASVSTDGTTATGHSRWSRLLGRSPQ